MWIWILLGTIAGLAIIASFIYFKWLRKPGKKQWEEANYLELKKFNKLVKNRIDTSKIVKSNKIDGSYELKKGIFKKESSCGFLIASEKSCARTKWLAKNKNFVEAKFGKQSEIIAYLLPKSHVVIFGGTGSGKTDTILIPNILLNSLTKDKPSGLVFDPKGEIYQKVAPFLLAQGYKVININLSQTANSDRWSPFQYAIDSTSEYIKYAILEKLLVESGETLQEIRAYKKTKISDAKTSIDETATKLVKLSDSQSSVWTNTASDILSVTGISLLNLLISRAFEEIFSSIKDLKDLKITSKNFENIKHKIFTHPEINEIINKHLRNLNVKNIANLIATTKQETWKIFLFNQNMQDKIGSFDATKEQWQSFKMNIANALSFLGGEDFTDFINASDFSYQDLVNKHTIIFINIPASAEKRKAIPSLMVEQIWAFLNSKSQTFKDKKLPIPFLFYFEELANIPKIECYSQILTLGRGMNIFSFSIVQSLKQFEFIYGNGKITEVWGNTMAKVYILGQDAETRKYVADQYGEVELKKENGENIIRPLVDVQKLGTIKQGQCLVMLQRQNPIWLNTASSSTYKFFNEWEKEIYQDSNGELNEQINKKYTKETDINILGDVISDFIQKQKEKYISIALFSLIKEILIAKSGDIFFDVKDEIIHKIVDHCIKNNIYCNQEIEFSNHELQISDENNEFMNNENIEVSSESKIYNIFINELLDNFKNYVNCVVKIRTETKYSKLSSSSLKRSDVDENVLSLGNSFKVVFIETFKNLKREQPNFPYSANGDLSPHLSFDNLANEVFDAINNNEKFINQNLIACLEKTNFIEKFIKPEINNSNQELKNLKELADTSTAIDVQETESKIDNLIGQTKDKTMNDILQKMDEFNLSALVNETKEQEKIEILTQEQEIIEFQNCNDQISDKNILFEQNLIQIIQRRIIDYWIAKLKNNSNYQFDELMNKIHMSGIVTTEQLDKFSLNEQMLQTLQNVNRSFDTYLNKQKKLLKLSFSQMLALANDLEKTKQKIKKSIEKWLDSLPK